MNNNKLRDDILAYVSHLDSPRKINFYNCIYYVATYNQKDQPHDFVEIGMKDTYVLYLLMISRLVS